MNFALAHAPTPTHLVELAEVRGIHALVAEDAVDGEELLRGEPPGLVGQPVGEVGRLDGRG